MAPGHAGSYVRVRRPGPARGASEAGNNVVYVHAGQQVIADYARGAAAAAPSFRYVYGSYVDEPLLRQRRHRGPRSRQRHRGALLSRNQQYSIVGLSDAAGTWSSATPTRPTAS